MSCGRPCAWSDSDSSIRALRKVIDLNNNPLCVILDLGCTRSMGSLHAVKAFEEAAWWYGITCEWKRCWTKMSFANSESAWLEWCVVVWFPTEPAVCTTIDVHEGGDIPILLSLPQMMNLGLDLKLRPDSVTLTCEALGYHNESLPFTTSKHIAMDLSRVHGKLKIANDNPHTVNTEKSFCSTDVSTEVPTDASFLDFDEDSEWSADEQSPDHSLMSIPPADDSAFPVRRRLREKSPVDVEPRPETGVPAAKSKSSKTAKTRKSTVKVKERGDPDASIRVPAIDRPEPLNVDEHGSTESGVNTPRDSGVDMPKQKKKKEPKGTDPTIKSTLDKLHAKLRDKTELYKLHLKHYHMSSANFQKRTSQLKIPKDIYDLYDTIVKECASCQLHAPAPERSKVTGMRALNMGDLWFVDHVDIGIGSFMYCVLIIVDAATNYIWAAPQKTKLHAETLATLDQACVELHVRPKAICGDSYFHENDFQKHYAYYGIKPIPLGPHTPWPNRAEAGVKLIKTQVKILVESLRRYEEELPSIREVSVRHLIGRACWARNSTVTYGGKTPAEMALGRRPPDILNLENMLPRQLATEPSVQQRLTEVVETEALKAHLEARQRVDIRRDLVARLRPSDGPFEAGQSVWYWDRDMSKVRGGEWIASRVISYDRPPMVTIDLKGQAVAVNQSKLRKNPDNWHDVVIPGLTGRDGTVTVPSDAHPSPSRRLNKKTSPASIDFQRPPSVNADPVIPPTRNPESVNTEILPETPVHAGSLPGTPISYEPEEARRLRLLRDEAELLNSYDPYGEGDELPYQDPPPVSVEPGLSREEEEEMFGDVDLWTDFTSPELWVPERGDSLRQFYSTSDKLSAVFSVSDCSVGEPVSLHEATIDECLATIQHQRPDMIWVSPPNYDEQYYSELSCWLAEDQMQNNKYFVIAMPWSSTFWNDEWMIYLQEYENVSYTNIQLDAYDPSIRNTKSLCLMHNFAAHDLAPLVRKLKRDHSIRKTRDPTDEYPVSFCENVYTFVADATRSHAGTVDQWPKVSPYHSRFLHDLLEDLDDSELTLLSSVNTDEKKIGCGKHVKTVKEMTLLSTIAVTDKTIKWLMNWLNSRPKGTAMDFGARHVFGVHPKQYSILQKIRKCYFPDMVFDHCHVFRGVGTPQLSILQKGGDNAVIVMWKKNDNKKRLYASTIESFEFSNFDPREWSIIVYYNRDGTVSAGGSGRPAASPSVPSTDNTPEAPTPPPVPPQVDPQRQYADPDTPIGFPPAPPTGKQPRYLPYTPVPKNVPKSASVPVPVTPPESDPSMRNNDSDDPDEPDYTPRSRSTEPGIRDYRNRGRPSSDADRSVDDYLSADDDDGDQYHSPRDRSRSRDDDERDGRYRSRSRDDEPGESSARRRGRSSRSRDRPDRDRPMRDDASRSRDGSSSDGDHQPSIRAEASRSRDRPQRDRSRSQDDHRRSSTTVNTGSSSSTPTQSVPIAGQPWAYKSPSQSNLPPALKSQAVPKTSFLTEAFCSHWVTADQQHDLFVLEDDDYWGLHTDDHKLSSVTSSFSFVRDMDGSEIDISVLESLPSVNKALYLDNSWHMDAHMDEVLLDIQDLPEWERHSLLSAFKTVHTVPEAKARKAPRRKVNAARREANAMEKRQYAKQFLEAKLGEYKSWSKENDVFDMVDMRKMKIQNYITGRWVLTIKRDKEGNFVKCKARWVLRGFQDAQHWNLQTDSPTSTRPGFRLQCQAAAIHGHDVGHIDLKTAFLQGEAFDGTRDVVCQLPPEAGYPAYMGARLKRAAYGLNDAPRLWWNRLDKSLRSYGLVPTRADRCCYVLYSTAPSIRRHVHWAEDETSSLANLSDANRPVPAVWEANSSARAAVRQSLRPAAEQFSSKQLDLEGALDLLLDPITGSRARNKTVEGVLTVYVDDCFFTGSKVFHEKVIKNLRKDFEVGHEDLNDVLFVGQRIRWADKDKPQKAHIRVDQEKKIEELSEIAFDSSMRDQVVCSKDLHTQFRSVLGQINWLQARTQYQACYLFSRSASASAAPTIGDVRALNKLVRKIRSEVVVLRYWPLKKASLRFVGYPDAAFRNNADKSSQRGQTVFLVEARQYGKVDARGSLIDYESQKIKRTVLSTTVSELYAFMKCFGTCQFLRGLWMDIFGHPAELHMRTDANNLVTTASTTHLPEQKETIHMINQLRHEACSGSIDDLAHVVSEDCLADCLTKASAKPQALMKSVDTGILPNVDKHPPFRELMKNKHKAYASIRDNVWECTDELISWLCGNINHVNDVLTFFTVPVRMRVEQYLVTGKEEYDYN